MRSTTKKKQVKYIKDCTGYFSDFFPVSKQKKPQESGEPKGGIILNTF